MRNLGASQKDIHEVHNEDIQHFFGKRVDGNQKNRKIIYFKKL